MDIFGSELLGPYFDIDKQYCQQYGQRTVVFIMNGNFYQIYGRRNSEQDVNRFEDVIKITNLSKTRKPGKKKMDPNNPLAAGFNLISLEKYTKLMVENDYTVVIVDQVTPAPNPKREVTNVYSPGTFFDFENPDSNNVVSIWIEYLSQKTGDHLPSIGLSSVDLTTGKCCIYEAFSLPEDKNYALDEAYRFLSIMKPKEILFGLSLETDSGEGSDKKKQQILEYLEITNSKVHFIPLNPEFLKFDYQSEFLRKVYPVTGVLTPIEYLQVGNLNYARYSFMVLLDFAYRHNENFIKKLDKPTIFDQEDRLVLGNNAITQLNVLENVSLDFGRSRYRSLLDVVDQTSTPLGRRYLKFCLVNPLTRIEDIRNRYDSVEELIKDDLWKKVQEYLKGMIDIERYARKITMKTLHPFELSNLIETLETSIELLNFLRESFFIKKFLPNQKVIANVEKFLRITKKVFKIENLKQNRLNDIVSSFFNLGIYKEIDELQMKIGSGVGLLESICASLGSFIDSKKNYITLKRNKRDGYYLSLSRKRSDFLKNILKEKKIVKINSDFSFKLQDLVFNETAKTTTKIYIPKVHQNGRDNVISLKDKLFKLIKKAYISKLDLYEQYVSIFKKIAHFVSIIDFLKSNAKCAVLNGYCKPDLADQDGGAVLGAQSFFNATNLRHPIAEKLRTDVEYIPHTIGLGGGINCSSPDGILLYGLNSAGKSTLQKAIGLSIIMAQCGMFVPAEKFVYRPYKSVFARITGNDNIFKGQSQFILEMSELDAILNRSSPNTLVIGDEICRGTEQKSANLIVATSIVMLAQTKCNFIFATHLHDIAKSEKIKALDNVKCFHLSVQETPAGDLCFDRILKSGSGPEYYGLTVAKHVIHNSKFHLLTQEIQKEQEKSYNGILNAKESSYNAKVYIHQCQICGSNPPSEKGKLDVHHINFQSNCDKNGFVIGKYHLKKNAKYNLVVLCKDCHQMVHRNEVEIKRYRETTKGIRLEYTYKIPIKINFLE